MDNIEVIKIIKATKEQSIDMFVGNQKIREACDLALSALEKQKKKHVKAKYLKFYDNFVYYCPVCGNVTGRYSFCSDCGQALDYTNPEPYTEEES